MKAQENSTDRKAQPVSKDRVMYSVAEAARLLGIGRSTAYELVLRGELQAVRLGRRWLVSPAVMCDLLGEDPPPPHQLEASS